MEIIKNHFTYLQIVFKMADRPSWVSGVQIMQVVSE